MGQNCSVRGYCEDRVITNKDLVLSLGQYMDAPWKVAVAILSVKFKTGVVNENLIHVLR